MIRIHNTEHNSGVRSSHISFYLLIPKIHNRSETIGCSKNMQSIRDPRPLAINCCFDTQPYPLFGQIRSYSRELKK